MTEKHGVCAGEADPNRQGEGKAAQDGCAGGKVACGEDALSQLADAVADAEAARRKQADDADRKRDASQP